MPKIVLLESKERGQTTTERGRIINRSCEKCLFVDVDCGEIVDSIIAVGEIGDCNINGYYGVTND